MNLRVSGLTTVAVVALAAMAPVPAFAAPEAGMRAARDAETGQLRAPTAEESKALDAAAAKVRAAKGNARVGMASGTLNPQALTHADGTVEQELDESTLSYSVARRNVDGTVEMVCVQGKDAASKAMKAPQFASRPAASKVSKEQLK